ncbi:MAG TPA: hypothetical protein PLL30_05690 [Candidatus Krumholzibacteria bacterium]|nr:hypothetical protein [Candidatus Krumholzibacteria bacterium]HPD71255.1 hypothetical protein [Candidatus Krumholzibacteria bacterium]HRY39045.1 hypothetical protein [Candidatus Krumholzibacteria bacterium]
MSTATGTHPLLIAPLPQVPPDLPEPLLDELRDLARRHDHCTARSRHLYEQFRKMLGQDRLPTCLRGLQYLARLGEPAGARLLAALLDANTPGAQLLPRIRSFSSTGRLIAIDSAVVGTEFLVDWQRRLSDLVGACTGRVGPDRATGDPEPAPPRERPPLPLLRRTLGAAVAGLGDGRPAASDLNLLAGLIRLECDAYQERVSRLAGSIDPFRVAAVMRALPLLNRADAEVRDLALLASWLEAGDVDAAFCRRVPTAYEVLDEGERRRFTAALSDSPDLAPLAAVVTAFLAAPLSVRQLAGPVSRLLALGRALQRENVREAPLGLLEAVAVVLAHCPDGRLELSLDADLRDAVGRILLGAGGDEAGDLAGLAIRDGLLVLQPPQLGLGDRIWRHDLPTPEELHAAPPDADSGAGAAATDDQAEAEEGARDRDKGAAAVKRMVMNNIGCVSVVLGFLRNPKVVAIPGLVAEVARRTRSSRVLEVIASDRHLTSGYANKDVPRALLESPVNVSINTLRKFIHVKYVSKTDLRRLAKDTARLRKEVCLEIEAYLESLT